jgi:FHS family L-fucose permease-like MFS transporter
MAGGDFTTATLAPAASGDQQKHPLAFGVMTIVFFMWGFITCLNDILIPHLKSAFSLSYTQAMLVQFCFFGAYFICSIPAGRLLHRVGYKSGILIGLIIAGFGALMFYPAAEYQVYGIFLAALFILASGITLLQVAANPYVVALGPSDTGASRLNLAQAFNSLGTTVAPVIGGALILGALEVASGPAEADSVKLPYLTLSLMLIVIAGLLSIMKLPLLKEAEETDHAPARLAEALAHRHLLLGAVAIFLYVGGEVAIGSFLVNFLGEPDVAGINEAAAANYVALYWGGAMVGRFIGAALMTKVSPGFLLGLHAVVAVLLVLTAATSSGALAMYAILAVGLCNSIMFPTIFSIALVGLGRLTSAGSATLCLAIVGGAVVPILQGAIADAAGLRIAFIVPALCYAYIAWYGIKGSRMVRA